MNKADKIAAEKYMLELQNNALDIYEKKAKRLVKKNHIKLEKLKKHIEQEKK